MLFTTFNIGKDMEVTIDVKKLGSAEIPTQNGLELGLLESFKCDPVGDEIKVVPANKNGIPVYRGLQSGWEGNLVYTRTGFAGDLLAQLIQETYHGAAGHLLVTVSQKIYNPGSDAEYIELVWDDATLRQTDAGEYAAEQKVTQAWAFRAPKRAISVSAALKPANKEDILAAMCTAVGISLT